MYDLRCVGSSDLFLSPDVQKLPFTIIEFHLQFNGLCIAAFDIERCSGAELTLLIKKEHGIYSTIDAFSTIEPVEYVVGFNLLLKVVHKEE